VACLACAALAQRVVCFQYRNTLYRAGASGVSDHWPIVATFSWTASLEPSEPSDANGEQVEEAIPITPFQPSEPSDANGEQGVLPVESPGEEATFELNVEELTTFVLSVGIFGACLLCCFGGAVRIIRRWKPKPKPQENPEPEEIEMQQMY